MLIPLIASAVATAPLPASAREGLFARHAVSIGGAIHWLDPPDRLMRGELSVASPDRRSWVTIGYRESGDELKGTFATRSRITLSGAAGPTRLTFEGYLGDVLWSPDSRHVALTLSGGGLGGLYDLFVLGGGRPAIPISRRFRLRLNPPRRCDLGRFSNVAAVKWLSNRRLLVMARQLWEDSCPEKYRAMFYDYDLATGRIRRPYTLASAKKLFAPALGVLAR